MITQIYFPKSMPFFKNDQEYQKFREDFYESVKDELKENDRRRALSELESISRLVD